MKKKLILILLAVSAILSLASCKSAKVVNDASATSFNAVLSAMPKSVTAISNGWVLNAPDKTVSFILSNDLKKSTIFDAMIQSDSKPFTDAGLKLNKLQNNMVYGKQIIVGADLGNASGKASTPIAAYEQIYKTNKNAIIYDAISGLYGIDLGNGNTFKWAKDMSKSDKDIIFELNPKPFIDAGADPSKVKTWTLTKVNTNGTTQEDRLVKAFNIK